MAERIFGTSSRKQQLFWGAVLLLTFFRVALFLTIPLYALADAAHDDLLLVQHAQSLANGEWLGAYSNTTLVKGISFPLFLAVCNTLCIPYALGLAVFYIFSILVFLRGIRSMVKCPYVMGILYLFLLYSPAMLSRSTQQRAYNMALLPSAILLVTGCCIGLFLRREENWKKMLSWSGAAGVSLAFFWYLREDSLWLLPFVLGALGISVLCILLKKAEWKRKLLKCAFMVLPFLILEAASLGISVMNDRYYGTSAVNERTSSGFSSVMSDLVQMDGEKVRFDVWVSRDTMEKAMELSPALASISESIDKMYESGWATNGEISGDIIAWALRDAVADAGYFTDGQTSEAFFVKVHEELAQAYEDGQYEKKDGIFLSALSDGFVFSEHFEPLLIRSLKTWKRMLFIEGTEVNIIPGRGSAQQVRYFEAMTGSTVVYEDNAAFVSDPAGPASQRAVVWGQRILKVYRLLTYPLAAASVLCYIWMTVSMILGIRRKNYQVLHQWLITTGFIGCGAVLIVEVCWFTTYLGEALDTVYHYCTGSLTIIQLVQAFTIGWAIRRISIGERVLPCKSGNKVVE